MPELHSEEGHEMLEDIKEDVEASSNDSEPDILDIVKVSDEDKDEQDDVQTEPWTEEECIKKFQEADRGRKEFGIGIASDPTRNSNAGLRTGGNVPSWQDLDLNPTDFT